MIQYLMPCLLCLFFFLQGCTSPRLERQIKDLPVGRSFVPENVHAVKRLPKEFVRVLCLPVVGRIEVDDSVSEALVSALRRAARFEVILVDRAVLARVVPNWSELYVDGKVPAALIQWARETYGVDAIVQLQVSQYRPYKPICFGLRGRLFTANETADVLWSIDEVFDAGQESVAIGARVHSERFVEQAFPLQSSYSSLFSPRRFVAYVGHVAFDTLPR